MERSYSKPYEKSKTDIINNSSQILIQSKHLLCTFRQSAVALIITVMRLLTVFWRCFWYCQLICQFGVSWLKSHQKCVEENIVLHLCSIFSSTRFWWDFNQETPNWQINWQHQKHRQKTVNSLITVMITTTADCRNVHSKCLLWIRIWELLFIMLFYRS